MKRILTGLVLIFSVLGLIISGYSLAAHYDTNLYEVCTVNETFDCSSVNASEYSVIFGVPVAFLGIIGYAVIAILLLIFLIRKSIQVLQWSVAISVGALLFSFYFHVQGTHSDIHWSGESPHFTHCRDCGHSDIPLRVWRQIPQI